MARPQRPLDPDQGPIQAFAAELRELHQRTGSPKFLQMARRTGKSRTALSEAVGGDHLPSWDTVAAFVRACDSEPAEWRHRWEAARDARATARQEEARSGESPAHTSSTAPRTRWSRRIVEYAAIVLVTAVISTVATAIIIDNAKKGSPSGAKLIARQARREAIITVQNKVALGANSLIEDTTPSYLSSKPKPFCSHYGCEVPGTLVSSGAMLVAVCDTFGVQMYNYNLDSTESENNPYRASSRLWYKVVFPDQRSGYISAVYIVAADRGGLGLTRCR